MPKNKSIENSSSFMNRNGKSIFVTDYDLIDEDMQSILEDTEFISIEDLEEEVAAYFSDLDKMMLSELNRELNRCATPGCGGTKSGNEDYCYYCLKKHDGSIADLSEYEDKNFQENDD